jgi:hypothetical protein
LRIGIWIKSEASDLDQNQGYDWDLGSRSRMGIGIEN